MKLLALASDPETFAVISGTDIIVDTSTIISASKENAEYVRDGVYIQHDNIMAEFNTKPSSTVTEFIYNTTNAIEVLTQRLEESGISPLIASSSVISNAVIAGSKIAHIFGCAPDLNTWTGDVNPTPNIEEVGNLRVCGGHLHMSLEMESYAQGADLVKLLDYALTLKAVADGVDNDATRRKFYGSAGSYRETAYPNNTIGIEYRTPSNYWLKSTELMRQCYHSVVLAVEMFNSGERPYIGYEDAMRTAIDTGNSVLATTIMEATSHPALQVAAEEALHNVG